MSHGAVLAVAGWVQHLRGLGAPIKDVRSAELLNLASGTLEDTVTAILTFLDADLAANEGLRAAVLAQAIKLAEL